MTKLNRLIILSFILGLTSLVAKAQCKFEHTLKIEHSIKDHTGGKILINSNESHVEFKIYILKDGIITQLEGKKISFKKDKNPIVVFDSLQPGKYYVVAEWGKCKSGIGGIEGITIN